MEDEGGLWKTRELLGGEAEAKAKVAPPTATSDSKVQIPEWTFEEMEMLEEDYKDSQGNPWGECPEINGEALYTTFNRDKLTETVKGEFLKVPVKVLDSFCRRHDPGASCSWNMLTDAVMFFKLHNTWQVYICPSCDCLRWFPDDDSLVLHLMYDHCHAFPFLRQNPTKEQSCSVALPSTVWKPINVRDALNILSTITCNLDINQLSSLEWPLSEDCRKGELLAQLLKGFELLLNSREGVSFTVRSGACLRALFAVASEHVLRHLDPMNILPPDFITLLYGSPLCFLLMEEDSLVHFVSLVEGLCYSTQASQNRELEGAKDDSDSSRSECPDAVSISDACDYFVLDDVKLNFCKADGKNLGSWLFKAPYFPTIEKLPTQASEILQLAEKKAVLFSEWLRTAHAQSDIKLLTSCLKILNMGHRSMPLVEMLSPELASNSEFCAANVDDMLAPSCNSLREPSKRRRTEFESQHYLELITSAWELQFLELQVRRLCAVDLRCYILLPLLKSFLRMKFYLSIRTETVFAPGGVKEEDAGEGNSLMEWSREEQPAEHVFSQVKGEPAAGDGSIMLAPDMSSYKRSEKVSTTPLEFGSHGSSAISIPDVDPSTVDSAYAGCIGSSASQVASADAAPSRSSTSLAGAIAKSEANYEVLPESDAEPESKAEPESERSQDVQGPLCCMFGMLLDSDSPYQSEVGFNDFGTEMMEFPEKKFFEMKEFSSVFWLMREKCAWENKNDGLFVCITINDVVKHCLENELGLETAQNILRWKTSRCRKYWRCFVCKQRFLDQKSHMSHFGLPWDNAWSVPIQFQQEGRSGENESAKERMRSLDDSITVDCTYRRFIVEMGKFRSSCQNEEEGRVENISELQKNFCENLEEIRLMEQMYARSKLGLTSEIGEDDAVKARCLKQRLSDFCLSDYKNEILPSIHSFMQKHMDSALRSLALQRLDELLRDVRCIFIGFPNSLSIDVDSPGKVIINIEEYDGGITFAYIGIQLKFSGEVSFKEPKKIKGIFKYSGISYLDNGIHYSSKAFLDNEIKTTEEMFYFTSSLKTALDMDLWDKLRQFQAELRELLKVK